MRWALIALAVDVRHRVARENDLVHGASHVDWHCMDADS